MKTNNLSCFVGYFMANVLIRPELAMICVTWSDDSVHHQVAAT